VSVPLTSLTITRAVVAVIVDLSQVNISLNDSVLLSSFFFLSITNLIMQPNNMMPALALWLSIIRARVDECVVALRASDPAAADALIAAAVARVGGDHQDLALVRPMPVSLLIIANKLDLFKDLDRLTLPTKPTAIISPKYPSRPK
jgi:hypothetical protein